MSHHRSFVPRSPPPLPSLLALLPWLDRLPSQIGNILDLRMEIFPSPLQGRRGEEHSLLRLGCGKRYRRIERMGKGFQVSLSPASPDDQSFLAKIGKTHHHTEIVPSHHYLTNKLSPIPYHPISARATRHLKLDHRDLSPSRFLRLEASYTLPARVPVCWDAHPIHCTCQLNLYPIRDFVTIDLRKLHFLPADIHGDVRFSCRRVSIGKTSHGTPEIVTRYLS